VGSFYLVEIALGNWEFGTQNSELLLNLSTI